MSETEAAVDSVNNDDVKEEDQIQADTADMEGGASDVQAEGGEGTEELKNGTKEEADGKTKAAKTSGRTIYVQNIPSSMLLTMEHDLREVFGKYGKLKTLRRCGIQVNGSSEDTTLCAYVRFLNEDDAIVAYEAEKDLKLGDNTLQLFMLKLTHTTLVLDSLPVVMSIECIKNLLSPCGNITKIVKIPGKRTAFVDFEDEAGVKNAFALKGRLMINNVKIYMERRKVGPKPPNVKKSAANKSDKNAKTEGGNKTKQENTKSNHHYQQRPYRGGGGFGSRGGRSMPIGGGFRGGMNRGRGGFRDNGPPGPMYVGGGFNRGGGGGWIRGPSNDYNNFETPMKRRRPNDYY